MRRCAGLVSLGFVWLGWVCATCQLSAQPPADIRELKLKDWAPRPMLVVKETTVDKPRFPAIDVHNHLGGGKQFLTPERVASYLTEMNEAGVRTVVNLDGYWGERLKETLAALDEAHPDRFLTFALVDFNGIDDENWSQRETERLKESFEAGAKGLKFHKTLGLGYRYKSGERLKVDDPKLAPLFELCGQYKRPVMIHTADPAAFFTPLDRFNERWHELNEHPNWLFYGDQFPQREELLTEFTNVVARHPNTTFIGAHFGNNVEDLATVGKWLDAYPNLNVDIDARISELGRQPYTARKFLLKYQDRIMFGTDTTPRRAAFRIYYRFLETDDEYFDCAASHHLQGFWMIYGVHLPDDVLEKVYYKNAERVLSGSVLTATSPSAATSRGVSMSVQPTADFEITGSGENSAWEQAAWQSIVRRDAAGQPLPEESAKPTRLKLLYSSTGLYALFKGADEKLTATFDRDLANLWEEDCFELFLQPDERQPMYFEYEISPLGYELPLIIANLDGRLSRWQPWYYDEERQGFPRKVRKLTTAAGGPKQSGAAISSWTAEIFLPYNLLQPLANVPPRPGDTWRANFYRMDHDSGRAEGWSWSPVRRSFHEYQNFGVLRFE